MRGVQGRMARVDILFMPPSSTFPHHGGRGKSKSETLSLGGIYRLARDVKGFRSGHVEIS